MKKLSLIIFSAVLAVGCAGAEKKLESAERAARAFACKVAVVEPYFDDVAAAKSFVQDTIGRKIDPVAALLELGVTLEEIQKIGEQFGQCVPPKLAPAQELKRELASS